MDLILNINKSREVNLILLNLLYRLRKINEWNLFLACNHVYVYLSQITLIHKLSV